MDNETAGDNELRELAMLMSLIELDIAEGTTAGTVGLGTVTAKEEEDKDKKGKNYKLYCK